jgi:hypothetical protein
MFTRTLLRQSAVRRTPFLPPTAIRNPAYYTTTTRLSAKKGAESRDSISTESTEYSKSGGDGASSSAVDDAAFDPDKTTPEEQYESAKKESGGVCHLPFPSHLEGTLVPDLIRGS